MVVQPSQNQVAATGQGVTPSGPNSGRTGDVRGEASNFTGPAAPFKRLLDIAVGEVKNDDRPNARAKRDQSETQFRPERLYNDSDESVIQALLAENRVVPRGTFVNVVI